jgi:hypothetical protein
LRATIATSGAFIYLPSAAGIGGSQHILANHLWQLARGAKQHFKSQ